MIYAWFIFTVEFLLICGLTFCLYQLHRNTKVFVFTGMLIEEYSTCAKRLIKDGDGENWVIAKEWIDGLPSYDEMMNKFWVWPLSKFVGVSCEDYVKGKMDTRK